MNIAELVATLGIDLNSESFDATKAAIQVVTAQLRTMALEAELASKKMNTALASATIGFFAGALFGVLALSLAQAAGKPTPRPTVDRIDGRFEESEAGDRAA